MGIRTGCGVVGAGAGVSFKKPMVWKEKGRQGLVSELTVYEVGLGLRES